MRLRRLLSAAVAIVLSVMLAGCDLVPFSNDNIISAPKLEGDMQPVQEALEKAVGGDITLKYATSGDYRSAFILKDLNDDGQNEAVAFYSTVTDATVTLHINLIDCKDGKWKSRGDLGIVGTDIESVSFADLNGDGSLEIIVGWIIYSSVEKQLGVYSFSGGTLTQRAMEAYTDYITTDLNSDEINELTTLYLNTTEKTSSIRSLSLSDDGVEEIGATQLDGGVTSYSKPVLSSLSDGRPAVYVDAVKGTGMLTEIIWFENGGLCSIFNTESLETSATYRSSLISSRDFNGDGVIDIPILELLPSTASLIEVDRAYVTNWHSFSGLGSSLLASTFMNYSDGYCLTIPQEWKNTIHLIRKTESRLRTFFAYDPITETQLDELFRIAVVTAADYDAGGFSGEGFVQMVRSDGMVYLVKVAENNSFGITADTVKSIFTVIK